MDVDLQVQWSPALEGDQKQDVPCKPENDKDARVSVLLSTSSPASSALFSISPPTNAEDQRFFSVPAMSCPSYPSALALAASQRAGAKAAGYLGRTPSWPPRGTPLRRHGRAQPGKSSCCNKTLGSGGRLALGVSVPCTASAARKMQTRDAERHVSALYLLLHYSPRIGKVDGWFMASAYNPVLKPCA